MNNIKEQNGITIIALIMVILVLIILSFVTVNIVLHHEFVGTAESAVDKANDKIEEHQNITNTLITEWNSML